jgi:hypothetical protein
MKKILFILFVLISNLSYGQKPTDKINVDKINIELLEKLILEEINNYRINYSYLEKIPNTSNKYRKINDPKQKLMSSIYPINSSRLHSQKMVDLDQGLFHDEKDDRNYNENCQINILSQNCNTYIDFAKDCVNSWKDSRLHNINLLSTSIIYGEVGVSLQQKTEIIPIFDGPIKVNDFYITFRGYVY